MKRLLIAAVMIGAMVDQLAAQGFLNAETAGAPQSLQAVVPVQRGYVLPALLISNPLTFRSRAGRHGDRQFADWGYASDPYFYPESDAFQLPNAVIAIPVIQQADAPPPPRPAPTPVQSEMHEYDWPSSGGDSSLATYVIVSKDGHVHFAALVWVQAEALCYSTPQDTTGRIPIDSVDRQATRQRNVAQQLPWLPDSSQTELSVTSAGQ